MAIARQHQGGTIYHECEAVVASGRRSGRGEQAPRFMTFLDGHYGAYAGDTRDLPALPVLLARGFPACASRVLRRLNFISSPVNRFPGRRDPYVTAQGGPSSRGGPRNACSGNLPNITPPSGHGQGRGRRSVRSPRAFGGGGRAGHREAPRCALSAGLRRQVQNRHAPGLRAAQGALLRQAAVRAALKARRVSSLPLEQKALVFSVLHLALAYGIAADGDARLVHGIRVARHQRMPPVEIAARRKQTVGAGLR